MLKKQLLLLLLMFLLPVLSSCVKQNTLVEISSPPPQKINEALILLTGYTGTSKGMETVTKYFNDNSEYYVFNAEFKSKKGFTECVKELKGYLAEIDIKRFDKVHFLCFIMGGIALKEVLKKDSIPNLGNIVLNRAPLQERIGHIVVTSYPHSILRKNWGETIFDMDTLDMNFKDFGNCKAKIGLLIETKISSILKYHIRQIKGLGELSFEPDKILKGYYDYTYVPLDHNEMYQKPEVYGPESLNFIRTGSFGELANRNYSGKIDGVYFYHQCGSCFLGALRKCLFFIP